MKFVIAFIVCFCLCGYIISEPTFFIPKNWPKPVYDFSKNNLSTKKIILGRSLFYDPILSKNNTISCESCHSPYSAFTHIDHALSHGIYDSIGKRNSPALMNLAWQNSFMWDGSITDLNKQAIIPITHPLEMGNSIEVILEKLNHSSHYKKLFFNAYADSAATKDRLLNSISQFLVTLISANSKYDQVKNGQSNFTAQEQKGYLLFKKKCSLCHQEPLFTSNRFENNGLAVDNSLNDFGRKLITHKSEDSLKFKIPTLRNIEFSFPYMHDGRFSSLSEVLNHYTKGIQSSSTLAAQLQKGIQLSANEKVDLIAFLLTLSDKEFIFNKKFHYIP